MDVLALLGANLGLLVFTLLSTVVIAYLIYAMLNPTRF